MAISSDSVRQGSPDEILPRTPDDELPSAVDPLATDDDRLASGRAWVATNRSIDRQTRRRQS
jgi:hypothetical protein